MRSAFALGTRGVFRIMVAWLPTLPLNRPTAGETPRRKRLPPAPPRSGPAGPRMNFGVAGSGYRSRFSVAAVELLAQPLVTKPGKPFGCTSRPGPEPGNRLSVSWRDPGAPFYRRLRVDQRAPRPGTTGAGDRGAPAGHEGPTCPCRRSSAGWEFASGTRWRAWGYSGSGSKWPEQSIKRFPSRSKNWGLWAFRCQRSTRSIAAAYDSAKNSRCCVPAQSRTRIDHSVDACWMAFTLASF